MPEIFDPFEERETPTPSTAETELLWDEMVKMLFALREPSDRRLVHAIWVNGGSSFTYH